jgi:hypothetical protein
MLLVDILRTENKEQHLNNLKMLVHWIEQHETHRNASNYFDLHKKVDQFDSFELLYDDERIVGFSGLYNNGYYPKGYARSSTRTYYHPDYRNTGSSRTKRWSEDYFIPYEVKIAKELNYNFVFISIELLMRRRSVIDLIEYLNKTGHWILHDSMCNTCRQHNDQGKFIGINYQPGCWQNVFYTNISLQNLEFMLPSISIEEYNKLYKDTQIEKIKRLR